MLLTPRWKISLAAGLILNWLALGLAPGWAAEPEAINARLMVKVFGPDEGMPSSSVTSVAQTPEGYIWVGSLMSGLLRFDGVRFVNFSEANVPSLPLLAGVRRLMVDQVGRLWINTYSSTLIIWERNGFQPLAIRDVRPE
jgi:hypothetical protein